jgi:hypothetical protein
LLQLVKSIEVGHGGSGLFMLSITGNDCLVLARKDAIAMQR